MEDDYNLGHHSEEGHSNNAFTCDKKADPDLNGHLGISENEQGTETMSKLWPLL